MGVLFGIMSIYDWDAVVTLGYCPSTALITVVTEATLLKYGLLLDVILFDNKLRTQISAFLEELMLNCCKHSNTKRQNKQVYTILLPIENLSCYLLSCHIAVRSNNIGVIFYSELYSKFVLLIFSAMKSSITACPRHNEASACFFGYDRCIPALLLFIQNVVRICVGFCLKQHTGCSHLFLFA